MEGAGGFQVEAERRKRATVLESEGTRESAINVAEGKKQAQILASEAEKAEQINQAAGQWRVEAEGGAGHGPWRVAVGAGVWWCSVLTGQALASFFQERPVQFWPKPRLKLKLFASWLQL